MTCYVQSMSRASSHALKHPPVTAPSEPAGAPSSFPELAVAIERERRRGRGAQSNASGRFEAEARLAFDDGWQSLDELPPFKTTVAADTARKVITRNDSPDIGFDRSINPYRGCEHGCVYCFAPPTHAYLGLSPRPVVARLLRGRNVSEIERFLDAAAHAGVKEASYVLLRLPLEVRDLFREWLMANYPDRYRHVFTLIRDMRGGRDYDSQWGTRMKGTGPTAWMIGRRFEIACEKLGLNKRRSKLTTEHFARPKRSGQQLSLF